MTRFTIPRFLRRPLGVGAALAALALGGSLVAASSASASPLNLRPESFSIFVSTFDQHGSVEAFGPVRGFGEIQTPAPDFAVLDLFHPYGTVNVWHTPDATPVIDWRTCTAEVTQYGTWKFQGGTGRDWGAFGFGHFRETQFEVLKRGHHGQCEAFAEPRYFQVSVQAEGLAAR
jgi:hypothetical protein